MAMIKFSGHILPPMPELAIAAGGQWKDDDLDYAIDVFVEIENNVVIAECDVEDYQRHKIPRMLLRAIDTAQAIVDVAAFTIGGHFLVHFEALLEPNGTIVPLKVGDADLAALCSSVSMGSKTFTDVTKIVLEEKNLIPALRDLIEATSFPRKVVPHCAKAIETLRHLIAPAATTPKQSWTAMREALRVNADYIKMITDESAAPRHGDHKAIVGETTDEIAKRSWTLMNRFFEYRKRGSSPLPLEEFPLLTG